MQRQLQHQQQGVWGEDIPGELAYVFTAGSKDRWAAALQSIEHMHVVLRLLPASELAPLSPSLLRRQARLVYEQASRAVERASLFAPEGGPPALFEPEGGFGQVPVLRPALRTFVEPWTVLERNAKLPLLWGGVEDNTTATAANGVTTTTTMVENADVGAFVAVHVAYALLRGAQGWCLLAAVVDERGILIHTAIIVEHSDTATPRRSVSASGASATASSSLTATGTPNVERLQSLLQRLLDEQVLPLLPLLAGALQRPFVRLVFVKLGGTFESLDREAWVALAGQFGWGGGGEECSRSQLPVPAASVSKESRARCCKRVVDVCLLSCMPLSNEAPVVPPAERAPDGKPNNSPRPLEPAEPVSLEAELEHAQHSLSERLGSADWWWSASSSSSSETTTVTAASAVSSQSISAAETQLLSSANTSLVPKQEPDVLMMDHQEPTPRDVAAEAKKCPWPSAIFVPGAAATAATTSSTGIDADSASDLPQLRVSLHACFEVKPSALSDSSPPSPSALPTPARLQALLSAVLVQWESLAALPLATSGAPTSTSNLTTEPCDGLPLHLTLLTRLHTLLRTL
jgi:hypothetical protein